MIDLISFFIVAKEKGEDKNVFCVSFRIEEILTGIPLEWRERCPFSRLVAIETVILCLLPRWGLVCSSPPTFSKRL